MKIYIASSWKNQHAVELLTAELRRRGHKVVSFVERAVADEGRSGLRFDVEAWIASEDGEKKFHYDTDGATKSDLVIYVGPSGPDAWAEVGAAWASGKIVLGLHAKGETIGLMRRMVEWKKSVHELLEAIPDIASPQPSAPEKCRHCDSPLTLAGNCARTVEALKRCGRPVGEGR